MDIFWHVKHLKDKTWILTANRKEGASVMLHIHLLCIRTSFEAFQSPIMLRVFILQWNQHNDIILFKGHANVGWVHS